MIMRYKDPRASMAALEQAALAARMIAIQTDTAIIVHRDEKLVRIPAAGLRQAPAVATLLTSTVKILKAKFPT
jgi:hypothetical protein